MTKTNIGPRKLARQTSLSDDGIPLSTKYSEQRARRLGFKSHREYVKYFRRRAGANSESEYQELLARKKGLNTSTEYLNELKLIRAQNPEYHKLAALIKNKLAEIGMTQSELARRVGIAPALITYYVKGYNYPKPKRLRKILQTLGVFHNTPIVGRSQLFGENVLLQKPRHQKYSELSNSIAYYLDKHGKDRHWLANATNIPLNHVTLYIQGLIYPKPARLKRIIETLRTLDVGN